MNLRIGLLTCLNCFVFRRESRSQQVLSKAETVVVFAGRCDFSRSSFNFTYLPACRDGKTDGELRPFSPSPWCDFDLRFVEREKEGENTHVTFYRRKNLHLCSQAGREARRAQSARDIFRAFILGCLCGVTLAGKRREGANGRFVTRLCYRHNFSRLFVRGVAPDDDPTEPQLPTDQPRGCEILVRRAWVPL